MKTFEEALSGCCVQIKLDEFTNERRREIFEELSAAQERYRDITKEAQSNPKLEAALLAILRGSCCGHHAMFNAFFMGLRVGVDMERSETGGIAAMPEE